MYFFVEVYNFRWACVVLLGLSQGKKKKEMANINIKTVLCWVSVFPLWLIQIEQSKRRKVHLIIIEKMKI